MSEPVVSAPRPEIRGPINRLIRFCLENKLVVFLLVLLIVGWGLYVMPFPHKMNFPSNPIPVDAIPDIGEKQQIVFTEWPGRSPQDVEDQVTYPLTIALQGTPGVRTIRSQSMFGFSTVFVIFRDDVDFYWARSRLQERLSVAQQRLPMGVIPSLGPDATALSQVYWYTLEGRGFDLQELRSIQDWYVRYAIQSTEGVSEVASVGGYVKEYQIDVDPDAMRAYGVMLQDVFMAAQNANIDVGADTIEFNGVDYTIRGKGFIKKVSDIENILLKTTEGVPIYVRNVANVTVGPAVRRGILDKAGAEVVGGVVLVRYGENPMSVIAQVKDKIQEIQAGLPQKVLPDGTVSQVRIVPFYDRTQLIQETLGTLKDALIEEVLITCFVVFLLLNHFRSNLLICANLPLAVMLAFVLMKIFHVESNLMTLGGIAIAIGSMVDMGIILCENMVRHFGEARPDEDSLEVIYRASSEVGSAVVTAISTTLVSFLPVFALTGPEGRLFRPLAYTKTFALFASVACALTVLPALAHLMFRPRRWGVRARTASQVGLVLLGIGISLWVSPWVGVPLVLFAGYLIAEPMIPQRARRHMPLVTGSVAAIYVLALLTFHWMPLGLGTGVVRNLIFVFVICMVWVLAARLVVVRLYRPFLSAFLRHKVAFLAVPVAITLFGLVVWIGFGKVFSWIPRGLEKAGIPQEKIRSTTLWVDGQHEFPGLGREFMPSLDEGAFLFMPTMMPHASIGQAFDILQKQDMAIQAIPEVDMVVGKIGRAETAVDPAPISMIETLVSYKPEYGPPDAETGKRPRLWRDHIRNTDDIWNEIVRAGDILGSTSAPKLQPIAARIVMLQSGMRAPMGVKVRGKDLSEIEKVGYDIARFLKDVPGVNPDTVIPDQVIAKPYLEIEIDRERMARYKVNIRDVQDIIEIAIGGIGATTTVEGRERYPVRVRYARELRDSVEAIERILVPNSDGVQVPLAQLSSIQYVAGPQEIKSEDTFLVSYVLFDKLPGRAEVDVVEEAQRYLQSKIDSKELTIPGGTHYVFAGTYENQIHFQRTLFVVLPFSLFVIFLILYFQFHSVPITLLVFIQTFVLWGGAFLGIWLIAKPWFLDFSIWGHSLRGVFHFREYNLSVSVWVGFIALFGLATDDAVVITTYLNQMFAAQVVRSREDIHRLVVEGARKRVRPCLMTTATTVLALLPVLTSSGKGADVMIPLALPLLCGMTIELITLYITPVCYCWLKEFLWKRGWTQGHFVLEGQS